MCKGGIAWSDERVVELRRLFDERRSSSAIAGIMGLTRNAVIGKLSRLGLTHAKLTKTPEEIEAAEKHRREKQTHQQRERRVEARSEEADREPPAAIPSPEPIQFGGPLGIPFGDLAPFSKYRSNQCRYMAAEEPGPEYRVCGNETAIGESWCAHCRVIVHDYRKLSDAEQARARNLSRQMRAAKAWSAA
ncbi:hypothetical protein IVA94_14710 [Bradyrhizobium sp. 156]|uniref:GcrA family cell cycle regulator n=1 Tax=Bradyrhizobium sp. 156 TaxID=2782630 RepID=UPI001FFA5028|nr:GcrA family cell cycle regulator [Bradyrhizobium sp. 156]MCK1322120.1 hypothetical protein [Bradyrhizobium sp. 156]